MTTKSKLKKAIIKFIRTHKPIGERNIILFKEKRKSNVILILGLIFGILASLFSAYVYETFKNDPRISSIIFILTILGIISIILLLWIEYKRINDEINEGIKLLNKWKDPKFVDKFISEVEQGDNI